MPSYISTLKDDDKINNILPRTVLKAISDDNGSYLDSGLQASDINYLKNGKAQTIEQKVDNLKTQIGEIYYLQIAANTDADIINRLQPLVGYTYKIYLISIINAGTTTILPSVRNSTLIFLPNNDETNALIFIDRTGLFRTGYYNLATNTLVWN